MVMIKKGTTIGHVFFVFVAPYSLIGTIIEAIYPVPIIYCIDMKKKQLSRHHILLYYSI